MNMSTLEKRLSYGRKQWRSIVWRMKAAVRKAVSNNGGGKARNQFRFQYDPSSYALNFDDGGYELREKTAATASARFVFYQNESKVKNSCSNSGGPCIYYAVVFVEA